MIALIICGTLLFICLCLFLYGIMRDRAGHYDGSGFRDFGLIAGIIVVVVGFGLICGVAPTGGNKIVFVPRSQATITKTPTAIMIETWQGRNILTTIDQYNAADTAKGVWYIHPLNAYGGDVGEHITATLIDPNPPIPDVKISSEEAR